MSKSCLVVAASTGYISDLVMHSSYVSLYIVPVLGCESTIWALVHAPLWYMKKCDCWGTILLAVVIHLVNGRLLLKQVCCQRTVSRVQGQEPVFDCRIF